jgi:hypothetical protein
VIHCCFHNKNLSMKKVCVRICFFFDSLALKPLGLFVILLGHFVSYSQPFHLVHG